MRRFSRLEFDDQKGPKSKHTHGEEIRDEHYFYDQAMRFWLAGEFELALRNYSRALEKNNAFFLAWLGQVLMLIELGEYHEATIWSDKAMELFPEHELIHKSRTPYARFPCQNLHAERCHIFEDRGTTERHLQANYAL